MHPDRNHILYVLGSTIVIQNIRTESQAFLSGHNNSIACVAVSASGKYVASGQVTHMGFKADIILWDFESRSILKKFTLHKVKVEQVAFSPNEKYLVSLGSQDDRRFVILSLSSSSIFFQKHRKDFLTKIKLPSKFTHLQVFNNLINWPMI